MDRVGLECDGDRRGGNRIPLRRYLPRHPAERHPAQTSRVAERLPALASKWGFPGRSMTIRQIGGADLPSGILPATNGGRQPIGIALVENRALTAQYSSRVRVTSGLPVSHSQIIQVSS